MKILGVDPGYATVGYGIIEYDNCRFKSIQNGAITTSSTISFPERLKLLYDKMTELIHTHKPDFLSIEELFFNTNIKTAMAVSHARGVLLLSAENVGLPIFEYTPLQIKQAVTGYGRADKNQVQQMVKTLMGFETVPKPDDVADAIAVAICHAHSYNPNRFCGGF